MAKYVVQPGDTLSDIAKKHNTSTDKITGYRSGNKDLIYSGETLEIPEESDTNTGGGSSNQAQERADSMRSELGGSSSSESGAGDESGTSNQTPGSLEDYFNNNYSANRSTYKENLEEAQKKRDETYDRLQGFRQDRYDEEYEKRGLGESKQRIDKLDNEIAELKQQRDEAIGKSKANPNASAATITGEVGAITEQLNNQINNKIDERNSVADSYNTELSRIDSRIEDEASDIAMEYQHYDQQAQTYRDRLDSLQQGILDWLQYQEEAERRESQFEQQLALSRQEANSPGSGSNVQSIDDPFTGEVIGYFDPDTGRSHYYGQTDNVDGGGGNSGGGSTQSVDTSGIKKAVSDMIANNPDKGSSDLETMVQNSTDIPSVQKAYYYDEIENQMSGPGVVQSIKDWWNGK